MRLDIWYFLNPYCISGTWVMILRPYTWEIIFTILGTWYLMYDLIFDICICCLIFGTSCLLLGYDDHSSLDIWYHVTWAIHYLSFADCNLLFDTFGICLWQRVDGCIQILGLTQLIFMLCWAGLLTITLTKLLRVIMFAFVQLMQPLLERF